MGPLGKTGREQLTPYTWGDFFAVDKTHRTATGQKTIDDIL